MNVLKTTSISISGIYQNDTTFSMLLLQRLNEVLPECGFVCDLSGTTLKIAFNGTVRFVLQAIANSTKISIRSAISYNGSSGNWGSTYTLQSISTSTTSTQTFNFTVNSFTFDDGAYLYIYPSSGSNLGNLYSLKALNVDADTDAYINCKDTGHWPEDVVKQSNDYAFSKQVFPPEEPAKCMLADIPMYESSKLRYVVKDAYFIGCSSSLTTGQVVTIDGERFVYVYDGIVAKL